MVRFSAGTHNITSASLFVGPGKEQIKYFLANQGVFVGATVFISCDFESNEVIVSSGKVTFTSGILSLFFSNNCS